MSTSRERFLRQLERCVKHQPDGIEAGPVIRSDDGSELYAGTGQFIAPEEMMTAPYPHCDTESVWGLRPPGEEREPPPLNTGDWA